MKKSEKLLQLFLIIITLVMTILRFLLNEKGRVNPDSIRFLRQANVFPVIDNTTTPLLYPLSIKCFTFFGFDEFWASKVVGIFAYLLIVFFAWKKNFFYREVILVGGLFSYVSIFSYTMSESLTLPFVFFFLYISHEILLGRIKNFMAVFYLTLSLLLIENIRYSGLFFIGGVFLYGLIIYKKKEAKIFIISAMIGFIYVVLYKLIFIDYFNENYVKTFLEIGLKPTSQLMTEFFQGMATSFNPLIHIANPGGGFINYGIYGIGIFNLIFAIILFIKNTLSKTEKYFIFVSAIGIICSFFIQYFYSVNPLDYRLLSPFIFSFWVVYFKKIFENFGKLTYGITFLSLLSGFVFTWLSRGNYLENRKEITQYLKSENLEHSVIHFYVEPFESVPKNIQVAELISTVNPKIFLTNNPKDSLKTEVLTAYKVLQKIKIDKNKYQ